MIYLDEISKSFSSDNIILQNISFSLLPQQTLSIIGPSGSGKTTLLNIIASLESPTSGSILNTSNENYFQLGYMMQEDSLLSWRTLAENTLLGVEVVSSVTPKTEILLDYYFELFELKNDKNIYPDEASAGMKQRVELIRTLLIEPSLILFDEPFSSLDFDIKLKIQKHLLNYQEEKKPSILLVTHDIEDAIALSDKVIIFSDKPTYIKKIIEIDLEITKRDPVEARKSPKFREYFIEIWDNLKYLQSYVEDEQK